MRLNFLSASLVNVQQTVLFSAEGAVVVNGPHPARYALRKLLVYGERSGGFAAKSNNDLVRTGCLLSLPKERRPWEVEEAWADLIGRGKSWLTRTKQGLQAADKAFPELTLRDWLKLPGEQ